MRISAEPHIAARKPVKVASEDALPLQIATCLASPSELADDLGDYASPLVFHDDRRVNPNVANAGVVERNLFRSTWVVPPLDRSLSEFTLREV